MLNDDFSVYAEPLVNQLEDDPNQPALPEPPPSSPPVTNFPGGSDIDGDPRPIHPNEEDSIGQDVSDDDVSDEDRDAARGGYPMAGTDVLGFYKSFRFKKRSPFPGKWGIFLLDAGVSGLTAELHDFAPRLPLYEVRQLAKDLILAHERYHFWIDAWALGQEITPLFSQKYRRYVPYLSGKKLVELTPDDYEESLANHYAFQRLKRRALSDGNTASSLLRQVLDLAPVPYSTFSFDKKERSDREGMLAITVANGIHPVLALAMARLSNVDPVVLSASLRPAERWHPTAGSPNCPVYYVKTRNYARLMQAFQGPDLTEFRRYVANYLNGQLLERTDHDYYRIDNREKVKVPNPHDKTVRGYELKGTIHKAGMTHKEFQQERQRTNAWSRHCPRPEPKPPLGNN